MPIPMNCSAREPPASTPHLGKREKAFTRFLPLDRHAGPTLVGALQRRALGSQEPEKNISYETRSPKCTRITDARSRVVMQRCAPRTRPSKDTQRHPFPRHMPPTRFLVHPVQTAILRQALPEIRIGREMKRIRLFFLSGTLQIAERSV